MKVHLEQPVLKMKPIVLAAFCFFIYMPNFNIPQVFSQILSIGLPVIYVLCNLKVIKIYLVHWRLLLLMVALILFSYFVPIFYDTADFSYFSTLSFFFKRAIVCLALLLLIVKKHGEERAFQYFIYYFILTHVAYVVGTLILVLIPGVREFWFSIVNKDLITMENLNAIEASEYTFRIGWQGFAGFHQTFYCTLSVIFALYLRYGIKNTAIDKKQFFIIFTACVLGNMFYGRSGLMATLVVTLVTMAYWNRKRIKHIILFGLLATILIVVGIFVLKSVPALNTWYEWMSSPITNLITTGDMQDKSFSKLQTMWQVEISEDTVLFGDGYYTDGDLYYMNTDVGFIRNVLFWGILGAILSYGSTLYAIWGFDNINKMLALQILAVLIVFEYKGAAYYTFLPIAFAALTAFRVQNEKMSLDKMREG